MLKLVIIACFLVVNNINARRISSIKPSTQILHNVLESEVMNFYFPMNEIEDTSKSFDSSETSSEIETTTTPETIEKTTVGADFEYVKIGSKVYIINNKNRANWFKAGHNCCNLGGKLVNIESAEEMSLLSSYLLENGYEDNAFWTSGSDMNQENTFIFWNNGKEMEYFNWAEGEPNDMYGNENCIHLVKREAEEFVMNDANCHHDLYFICEDDF